MPPLLKTLKSVKYVKQMNEKNTFNVKIRCYPEKSVVKPCLVHVIMPNHLNNLLCMI